MDGWKWERFNAEKIKKQEKKWNSCVFVYTYNPPIWHSKDKMTWMNLKHTDSNTTEKTCLLFLKHICSENHIIHAILLWEFFPCLDIFITRISNTEINLENEVTVFLGGRARIVKFIFIRFKWHILLKAMEMFMTKVRFNIYINVFV